MTALQITRVVVDGAVNFIVAAGPTISSAFACTQSAASATSLTALTAVNAAVTAGNMAILGATVAIPVVKLAGRVVLVTGKVAVRSLSAACKIAVRLISSKPSPGPNNLLSPPGSPLCEGKPPVLREDFHTWKVHSPLTISEGTG